MSRVLDVLVVFLVDDDDDEEDDDEDEEEEDEDVDEEELDDEDDGGGSLFGGDGGGLLSTPSTLTSRARLQPACLAACRVRRPLFRQTAVCTACFERTEESARVG